jgi:two-component system, NarL family, response regulator NreC
MGAMFTVVLADDHHLIRQAMRSLLEAQPGISVIGEAADGFDVVGLVERLRPDILLASLAMPGLGGSELPLLAKKRSPHTKVILLSTHGREGHILQALRNGADGILGRDATAADLTRALHAVTAGHRYVSTPFGPQGVQVLPEPVSLGEDAHESLTRREREVFQLAAEGLGNTEIGVRLGVSPRTVETHRAHVMRKLGLRNQADVIRYALRRGVLAVEDP